MKVKVMLQVYNKLMDMKRFHHNTKKLNIFVYTTVDTIDSNDMIHLPLQKKNLIENYDTTKQTCAILYRRLAFGGRL